MSPVTDGQVARPPAEGVVHLGSTPLILSFVWGPLMKGVVAQYDDAQATAVGRALEAHIHRRGVDLFIHWDLQAEDMCGHTTYFTE